MNDYLLNSYTPQSPCQNFTFDQGIVTAVHAEGVIQAYDIAKILNDRTRLTCYQNFIQESIDYIITLQETDQTTRPLSAIGGFWDGPAKKDMRVDRNQHAVMAIMDAVSRKLLP
jgi:hypothetical protein